MCRLQQELEEDLTAEASAKPFRLVKRGFGTAALRAPRPHGRDIRRMSPRERHCRLEAACGANTAIYMHVRQQQCICSRRGSHDSSKPVRPHV